MRTLCLASNNAHKIAELSSMLEGKALIKSLKEIGHTKELEETQGTIEGNSRQKACFVWDQYQLDCLSDDTGLEVFALDHAPGVDTAFYAGPQRSNLDNIALLLKNLEGKKDRRARFRTVITYVRNGEVFQFEGIVSGEIALAPSGAEGFGYDPVFIPEGGTRTFAQMTMLEKNLISHRGRAFESFFAFFNKTT